MLSGYKTYLIAAGMLAYQLLGWGLSGTPPDLMGVLNALGLAALRAGVAKAGPQG